MEYIQRHGQRTPLSGPKKQKTGVIKTKMNVTSRKRRREEEREKEKWQANQNTPSVTNKVTPKEKLLNDWDNIMTGVNLPDGADVDD